MLACSWKKTLGIECPGCGFQRSVVKLSEGEFYNSFLLFPATIPIILTFLFLLFHLKFNFKHGAKILILLFSTSAFLMLISFVLKIVNA